MEMTTREAAERLNVTQTRVSVLVRSGALEARRMGSMWLVDADSVDRQAELMSAGAKSRSMSPRSAWALAELADDGTASWMHRSELTRLRTRLDHLRSTEVLQRWMRGRSVDTVRYRVGERDIDDLLRSDGVVATGVSASAALGLALGTGGAADAYATKVVADRLERDFVLIRSRSGNLTLRLVDVDDDLHLRSSRLFDDHLVAARLVVGVDLVDDTDTRTKSTGRGLIEDVLSERRWRLVR